MQAGIPLERDRDRATVGEQDAHPFRDGAGARELVNSSEPRRDVTLAVEDAPDIDALTAVVIEDEIRIAGHRPMAQTGQTQLQRVSR
jgi:hypothetical protein